MNWSIKLFRIRGIDVKVHLTFLLILVWAAFQWSGATGAGLQGALFGVLATLLLFVAVTIHELGHSLQALRFGVKVKDITLFPLGGVAQMEEMPEKPSQELRIAVAGPLVNFVIAGILFLVGSLLRVPSLTSFEGLSGSIGQVSGSGLLAYLILANLILGVFNLIPAFPMDGGRVLRALLAMRMERTRATRIAAIIGQGLAFLFGLWGIISGDFFLVLIAVFIWLGAGQESQQVVVKDLLRGVKVRRVMTVDPQVLKANEPLTRAVELTLSSAQSDFPVVEWGTQKVVGVLGEAELVRGLSANDRLAPIREVMRSDVPMVQADQQLYEALETMIRSKAHAVPVVDGSGVLVGLLTNRDVNEAYRLFTLEQKIGRSAE